MASTTWETKVTVKFETNLERIPGEWLLPATITDALQTPLADHPNRLLLMDIAKKSGILSEKELDITENYTVEDLLRKLREGDLSSLEVTVAFSKRAAMAQQLLSCLTETYFPEAMERARFLDNERARGRIVGPLHGLPVSLKDSFQITGSAASIGFVSLLERMSEKNSPLVEILLSLGAVVYVKTNIPQTMMTADSHNNIFGRTLNPHNTSLTAGGSSGGEGALVAFRGSPLGIGTDVAGSIRIPSLCCGTYGFKPSTSRIPFGGQTAPVGDGMSFFLPSAGPLAKDMPALSIFCRSVLSTRPALYDSTALDVPWRDLSEPLPSTKLKLGLLGEDPVFPLHPPVKRALANAVKTLEAQGHEIIPLPASCAHVANALALAFAYFQLDDTAFSHIAASGEPLVPSVAQGMHDFGKFKSDFLADIADLDGISRLAALNVKRHSIAEDWRAMWQKEGLDGVMGPVAQSTAVRHDTYGLPPYTLMLNVLDYPACIIPVGTASSELDAEPLVMGPGQLGPNYEPKDVHGAPTAIQVFTNTMRDEECLQVATIIDKCLTATVQTGRAREHRM
ncbi:amidase [Decorospora gaudefroyi]|uniref:amidase n=1 Tax=Decorospora gaudefroyi TaxID=184978 RepID=A0A6A5KWA5_9PLEO|nr:amidase [Decorospora gaudefroyi]